MTADEVFGQIAQRMINGFMFHNQMTDYFNFLGLKGFSKCQEYHYYEESRSYRELNNYYICHHDKLVLEYPVKNENAIPDAWRNYTRQNVDAATIKAAVKTAFEKWIKWETETKKYYEAMFKELFEMGEIASSHQVKKLVLDVDEELKIAKQEHLRWKAVDYNISDMMMEQDSIYKKYSKKIKK